MLKHLFSRDPGQLRPLDDDLAAHRPARVFPPGGVGAYSSYGAALAGDAPCPHAEGQGWENLLEAELLRPAGMDHTTASGLPRALVPPRCQSACRRTCRTYHWTGLHYTAQPYELSAATDPGRRDLQHRRRHGRYMTLLLGGGVIDGRTILRSGAGG